MGESGKSRQLLRKEQRRAQLIRTAASAFVRGGFTATSLEDVAAEAGVTKVVIYHHFDSKRDLYLAVLRDARNRLQTAVGDPDDPAVDTLHQYALAARDNPDGFRLLYRHARREPEFTDYAEDLGFDGTERTEERLHAHFPDPEHRAWVAALLPAVVVDTALTWLDAGQPVPPEQLAGTMRALVDSLLAGPPEG
ncbi:TetR/AcrR family transcriptional regulator [Salinifilum ghardaiensis]